jgi:hypothetical protein
VIRRETPRPTSDPAGGGAVLGARPLGSVANGASTSALSLFTVPSAAAVSPPRRLIASEPRPVAPTKSAGNVFVTP